MRSMWKGAISFGLVNIPVRLYAATEERDVRFNTLHRVCGAQIRYQKYCPHCERPVEQAELVRGYPIAPGSFITVEEEELDALPVTTAHTVEITDFVSLDEIDPIYFHRSYYMEPDDGAQKAYALLHRAMRDAGRVALAKVAIRHKESLACVRVYDRALVMETMFYPDEIRSLDGLSGLPADVDLNPRELEMAARLIDAMTEPFDPAKYRDRYREALLQLIEEKARGDNARPAPAPATAGRVIDLMEALEASLKATAPRGNGEVSGRARPGARRAPAKEPVTR